MFLLEQQQTCSLVYRRAAAADRLCLCTPEDGACFCWTRTQNQHTAQTRRLRPHTHTLTHSRTHTNTNPSKHPLLRLSIPLCRHTEGDSVARLPWKPCRVYQPALPLADCGSHVFVCVCECGEWVCTCVGVCETVKPIQGSALSCWRGRQKIGYTCKKPIERRLALSPAIKATISVLTCRNTRRYFTR